MGLLSKLSRLGRRASPPSQFEYAAWRRAFGSQVEETAEARAARADELFPVHAYRGMLDPPTNERGWQWFTDDPVIAGTYAPSRVEGSTIIPSRINPQRTLDVDARGGIYTHVPTEGLPPEVLAVLRRFGSENTDRVTTDRLAGAARGAGYDSVTFRNIRDARSNNGPDTPLSTVYAVFEPKNVRSRFAQFDPARADVDDWLAGIGAGAVFGGGLLSRAGEGNARS